MISDFAVFLTIVLMVLIDYLIGVPSQKLQVPSNFKVGIINECAHTHTHTHTCVCVFSYVCIIFDKLLPKASKSLMG